MTVYQFNQSLYNTHTHTKKTKQTIAFKHQKPVQQKRPTWKLKQFLELFLLDSRPYIHDTFTPAVC